MENFFGCARSHDHMLVKPTCFQFSGTYRSLLINNLTSSHSIGANCAPDGTSFMLSWADHSDDESDPVKTINYAISPGTYNKKFSNDISQQCSLEAITKDVLKNNIRKCSDCTGFFFSDKGQSSFGKTYNEVKEILKNLVTKTFLCNDLK